MRLALYTDSVSKRWFDGALDFAQELGLDAVEIAAGGQSPSACWRKNDRQPEAARLGAGGMPVRASTSQRRDGTAASTRRALRSLARRWQQLDDEARELAHELATLINTAAPRLLAEPGVGPDTTGKLLVIAS